uniref:Uncharacterized protein n=1 Tax=Picea glauca TaxID=3330 RepID=A0A101M115_PICGL|nr:hypothetical protein ABT39_MTgene4406 [Picea glauca]QHR86230.1 hypothetical protein Q903MT_gene229 [Picea sitchensis]
MPNLSILPCLLIGRGERINDLDSLQSPIKEGVRACPLRSLLRQFPYLGLYLFLYFHSTSLSFFLFIRAGRRVVVFPIIRSRKA